MHCKLYKVFIWQRQKKKTHIIYGVSQNLSPTVYKDHRFMNGN